MKQYYFISGLPRSGSTLLSSILRQNPKFHADISSSLEPILSNCVETLSCTDSDGFIEVEQRKNTLKFMVDGYYHHIKEPIIFDTNRSWTSKTFFLKTIFPQTKIICCVRDIVSILNSIELIQGKNSLYKNWMVDDESSVNVFTRCESLMRDTGLVGSALKFLMEGYCSNPEMIYICDYKTFCEDPEKMMRGIYQFLNIEYYSNHDFDNVEYSKKSFDSFVGLCDLHKTRKKVSYDPPKCILPPMLVDKYKELEFWQWK